MIDTKVITGFEQYGGSFCLAINISAGASKNEEGVDVPLDHMFDDPVFADAAYKAKQELEAAFYKVFYAQPAFAVARDKMLDDLRSCFEQPIYSKIIQNEYSPNSPYYVALYPWLLVTTRLGVFKIGWRKRVIEIDWGDAEVFDFETSELFADQDTTKNAHYIHAWSLDKAREYIRRIFAEHDKIDKEINGDA